jgi:hypothetical protein
MKKGITMDWIQGEAHPHGPQLLARQTGGLRRGLKSGFAQVFLGFALLGAGTAQANDGAFYGSGATVFPVQDTTVTMAEEDLTIEQVGPPGSYVEAWQVAVRYRFENTSDQPVTVQMGFPEGCARTPYDDADEESGKKVKCRPTITGFVAEVDGTQVPVRVKPADKDRKGLLADTPFDKVHTFEVKFAPKQSRIVQHRYRNGASITSPWSSHLDYILRTATLWKGPIGRLHITVTLKDRFASVQQITEGPEGPQFPEPNEKTTVGSYTVWKWRLENFLPPTNLNWMFNEPATLGGVEAFNHAWVKLADDPKAYDTLDAEALRRLRNLPYAAKGYVFKDAALTAHFAKAPWYVPRLDFEPRWLTAHEMKFVKQIKEIEARLAKVKR